MTIHAHIQGTAAAAAPPEFRDQLPHSVWAEPVEASSFSPGGESAAAKNDDPSTSSGRTAVGIETEAENHFRAALTALDTTQADAATGWTPQRQSRFLAAIADGATVADAAQEVGLSRRSAYACRRRAGGRAFDLGWQAAELLARDSLRETLWDRAQNGQSWTTVRDDGERVITTTRHRFDNRLALSMLTRLEARVADSPHTAPVRLAEKFDEFLASVERGEAAADPVALVDRLCPPLPPEPAIGTCESCEPADDAGDGSCAQAVWFDPEDETWMTRLAPPDGYDGQHYGFFLQPGYSRTLMADEVARVAHFAPLDSLEPPIPLVAAKIAEREAWFAAAARALRIADVPALLAAHDCRTENPLPPGGDDSPGGERGEGAALED